VHFDLPEVQSHVWISGFRTKPSNLDELLSTTQLKFPNASLQLFDLEKIPGSRYLLLAALNALKSHHSKHPISKTLGMELLLFVAANRQIHEAIKQVGLLDGTKNTAAMAVGQSGTEVSEIGGHLKSLLREESDDAIVDQWTPDRIRNVCSAYGIGPKEIRASSRKDGDKIETIQRLAIERSAMLTIKK
jgi:tRNA threonylcarbamoyladenosine modification (KEOPS) complex Cgi121 subunit